MSEDVNVEHLLDVFTSVDTDSKNAWDVCARFMEHLYWHKPRLVTLGPRIEALPDDHPSEAQCMGDLSRLFYSLGNWAEYERLLTNTLRPWREQGDDYQVAQTLTGLSEANRLMYFHEKGIQHAKEASRIFERLGDTAKQARCLISLAWLLYDDGQPDAAEEAACCAIYLLPEEGEQFRVCRGHRILGNIYRLKGDREKAIHHFEVALEIASLLNLNDQSFWIHHSLSALFAVEGKFDDAQAHIERAKSHAIDDPYILARAMWLQASFWYDQRIFEEAGSEASHAADIYEKLGASQDLEGCRVLLQRIDEQMKSPVVPGESDVEGELLEMPPLPVCVNAPFQG